VDTIAKDWKCQNFTFEIFKNGFCYCKYKLLTTELRHTGNLKSIAINNEYKFPSIHDPF
jgi:hypothetical protein